MENDERAVLWRERVAQWRASGRSQRAFALDPSAIRQNC
jgi:hypothetical protein